MHRPKFSVVIPTRLGHATLPATLKTCLDQNFRDYEILVVDNASLPETRAVVEQLSSSGPNSDLIRYFRHDEPLAMTDNWNRALSYARGEWITFLGDDDALLPGALRRLDAATENNAVRSVRWNYAVYTWPDHIDATHANRLSIPLASGNSLVPTAERLAAMATGLVGPNVPSLYYGLIHRTLVEEALVSGPVFEGRIPDYYSAVLFAALANNFVEILDPVTVAGLSGKANGMAHLSNGPASPTRRDFEVLNAKSSLSVHSGVPDIQLTCVYVWDAIFRVRDRLGLNDPAYDVSPERVAQVCLQSIWTAEPERSEQVRAVQDFLLRTGSKELPVPREVSHDESRLRSAVLPASGRLGVNDGYLTLDTAEFEVADVAGAARLATISRYLAPAFGELRQQIALRDQLSADQAARVSVLDNDLAVCRAQHHQAVQQVLDVTRRLGRAQAKRRTAEAELQTIRRSRSWRLARRMGATASSLRSPFSNAESTD